ncbi:MAG TPA: hypothetical protein VMD91_08110 [Candidatus Sulfotelmatobacter sp.]|nr:hypothetical protein [Candidatus Sulfotelmatobacter sp.]
MATTQVWEDTIHLLLGNVIYTHLYAYVDPALAQGASLQNAFTFEADVRVASAELYTTARVPLANGALTATPTLAEYAAQLGTVQGEIDDWNCLPTPGAWATATAVHFLIAAKADASVPLTTIEQAMPALKPVLGVVGPFLPQKVRITIGHAPVHIPIARDQTGAVVAINGTRL